MSQLRQQSLENKNEGKKQMYKLVRLLTGLSGYGYEKETTKEKLYTF